MPDKSGGRTYGTRSSRAWVSARAEQSDCGSGGAGRLAWKSSSNQTANKTSLQKNTTTFICVKDRGLCCGHYIAGNVLANLAVHLPARLPRWTAKSILLKTIRAVLCSGKMFLSTVTLLLLPCFSTLVLLKTSREVVRKNCWKTCKSTKPGCLLWVSTCFADCGFPLTALESTLGEWCGFWTATSATFCHVNRLVMHDSHCWRNHGYEEKLPTVHVKKTAASKVCVHSTRLCAVLCKS